MRRTPICLAIALFSLGSLRLAPCLAQSAAGKIQRSQDLLEKDKELREKTGISKGQIWEWKNFLFLNLPPLPLMLTS